MVHPIRSGERSRHVLRALYRHGPLTTRGLREVIEPRIHPKRLQEVLSTLYRKGWLNRRSGMFESHQINQRGYFWQEIAQVLDVPPDSLKQRWARFFQVAYEDEVAIWSERLKHLFPSAAVDRAHELGADCALKDHLLSPAEGRKSASSILLRLPEQGDLAPLTMTIRLLPDHLREKDALRFIRHALSHPLVNGALFLKCKDISWSPYHCLKKCSRLRNLDQGKTAGLSSFAFADWNYPTSGKIPDVLLHDSQTVTLIDWVRILRTTKAAPKG